jgi:hypothetical protein
LYTFIYNLATSFSVRHILRFFQLQLFLTFISWPILLYWGLPLSLLSPIGNFIFAPFLTVFLVLSSLIFFCELVYIPAAPFISMLEYVSSLWATLLSWTHRSWLLACAQPFFLLAIALPLGACSIIHFKKLNLNGKSTLVLCAYFLVSLVYLTYPSKHEHILSIPYGNKELSLYALKEHTILIDSGALGRSIAAPTWVAYTLAPYLIKQGISVLDYLIILKPSVTVFRSITRLLSRITVRALYLPPWHGTLSHTGWKAWEELLKALKSSDTCCLFLNHSFQIPLKKGSLSFTSENKNIYKNKLCYPLVTIQDSL